MKMKFKVLIVGIILSVLFIGAKYSESKNIVIGLGDTIHVECSIGQPYMTNTVFNKTEIKCSD